MLSFSTSYIREGRTPSSTRSTRESAQPGALGTETETRLPFPHLATRSQPRMDYRFINHDELVDIIRTKTAGQDYQVVDVRGTVRGVLSLTGLPLTRQALSR